jgi:predicted DsbA family dithiol-disulfide isomerase
MSAVPTILFADFACPYSYVTEAMLWRLEDEGLVRPSYRAFELYPAPSPLPAEADVGWMRALASIAGELGLTLRDPLPPVRTRKAHEAAAFAEAKGHERAMRQALYAAWFAERRDVGRIDVLAEIAGEVGLDRSEAKVVLDVDTFAVQVRAQDAGARRSGIASLPALAIGEGAELRLLVGARPVAELRAEILDE